MLEICTAVLGGKIVKSKQKRDSSRPVDPSIPVSKTNPVLSPEDDAVANNDKLPPQFLIPPKRLASV